MRLLNTLSKKFKVALAATLLFSSYAAHSAEQDYTKLGQEIQQQEKTLVFTQFTNQDALDLGLLMLKKAQAENKTITIDITRNGQQLFHYAMTGTAVENDIWVDRKNEVTRRSGRSSLAIWYMEKEGWMEKDFNMSYLTMWGLNPEQAMHLGGTFPLTIKNVGVVGTITSSGLPHYLDHQFVVESITDFLNKK